MTAPPPPQVEVVDTIPRNRFVYVQWIGERSRPMAKAKTTTHRTQIVELFQVYIIYFVSSYSVSLPHPFYGLSIITHVYTTEVYQLI